ncbi:conserved protein of unknown function [Methylacidimicrobium sp. AP8]|nr:conserved protein of unknown function [Methylacidimicrobium sp. AP8]CAB4243786.1 conserved protein of unknown function [Methylacidimicrobium sp. AP8]CAB4243792.1 conserved protein of unknown function [Methylacidimicrobium sp. AP8]CAB4243936.1 conserved protein of unknown function [Methylacidimicrobium sp. AP8]
MKLSVWAKRQGICYKTAWRMWKEGRLPVPAEQLPTGTVIVHAEPSQPNGVALYARVSSSDQKADLDRQLARLTEFALKQTVADRQGRQGGRLRNERPSEGPDRAAP